MAKFQFRLQSVMQLRERKRDEVAQAYQQALLAMKKLRDRIEELLTEHAAQMPVQARVITGLVATQTVLESQRYQLHLMQEINQLRSQLQLVEQESEKRRWVLVKHEQELRSIEKLKERQLQEWQASNARQDQIALDQWSGFRYWETQQNAVQAPGTDPEQGAAC